MDEYGFKAHSDGDVLIPQLLMHFLGLLEQVILENFFPDTDEKYKGIDSKILLDEIVSFIYNVGYEIVKMLI